jgi:NADP-dependent 3-hydroxy acid dehydrogenase YdfG
MGGFSIITIQKVILFLSLSLLPLDYSSCLSDPAVMSKSRVAAIFGAGAGNGAAFAKRFLREGYSVAVLSRSKDSMDTLAATLGPNDRVRGYPCDVTSDGDVAAALDAIRTDFGGPVSTVVYNAGSGAFKPFDQWQADEITAASNVNAAGLFRVAKAAKEQLVQSDLANIVVVGAGAATRGRPMTVGFAAGKAAQRSVAQSLARAWGPEHIHVSYMIIDGMIDGDRARTVVPDKPADFFLQSDDIAEAIWNVVNQKKSAWTFEFDVRPFGETW